MGIEKIFNSRSGHLISIIERKVQDELVKKYPEFPVYQVYWRPDGKFGSSLISTTTVLALRRNMLNDRIYFPFGQQGQQKISSVDLEYFSEMLLTPPYAQCTSISVCNDKLSPLITPVFISSLEQSLQKGLITHLTLTKIGSHDTLQLKPFFWGKLLRHNNLQHLDLSQNRLGDTPLDIIAYELFHNSQLKTLKIGENAVSHKPAIAFANALRENNVLTELDFSGNNLCLNETNEGIESLCSQLSLNTTLKKLNLESNHIMNAHCLIHLTKLTNLTELDLRGKNTTDINTNTQLEDILKNTKISFNQ